MMLIRSFFQILQNSIINNCDN